VSTRGHAIFADQLARFADGVHTTEIAVVARRATRGVTVAVHGRSGVGRGTVARALAAAGVALAPEGDVDVHVVAEVVKPEDRAAIAASAGATLVVLNKADLLARPRALCARYRELTGVPTVPMAAHLAVAEIDDAMLAALRAHATAPPSHPQAPVARWLLDRLDLAGIACAVRALRAGADAGAVRRVLRRASGVDGVVSALAPMIAETGYRRVRSAVNALEGLMATADDDLRGRIAKFLSDDDTVLACMAAAVDVVEASGMTVDRGDDVDAHLRRATQWHRFRSSAVDHVHRSCGSDIMRGSLRLWRRAQLADT
jgi:hypothetical protein